MWKNLQDGAHCNLENEGGFFHSYRVYQVKTRADLSRLVGASGREPEDHLVLLEDFDGLLGATLKQIGSVSTVVTCSLGDGQPMLASALRATPRSWSQLFAFENTLAREFTGLSGQVDQVVVDRICWGSGHRLGAPNNERYAKCESGFSAFWIPTGKGILKEVILENLTDSGFDLSWLVINEYGSPAELEKIRHRKRALVNASHALLAILCFEVLRIRGMNAKEQYLATVEALLAKDLPEAKRGLDLYIRLRAAEVAWLETGSVGGDAWQATFATCYGIAQKAIERFLGTSDRLDRVFSSDRLAKDLGRRKEHISGPLDWFESHRDSLRQVWRLGRPSEAEVWHLRSFLDSAFNSALEMASR